MTLGPVIVQSDMTLLLEVDHPEAAAARSAIAPFSELEKSPEHVHTYRITPLALWNARASGIDAEGVVKALLQWSKYPVPPSLLLGIEEIISRYGRLRITMDETFGLCLVGSDRAVFEEVLRTKAVIPLLGNRIDQWTVGVRASERGRLKQSLIKLGWPAEDEAGYVDGTAHDIVLRSDAFQLRPYQVQAAQAFADVGNGVIVLPCGSGKTLVGVAAMAHAASRTLILVTSAASGHQWRRELIERTYVGEDEIGEYSGQRKEVRPITIATYQILATKRKGVFPHMELFGAEEWGLIIYDEVHLLPAPVFRMTADIQSRRRLGLTATLIREDNRESDVFTLIGPKRFDMPWREVEDQGWIAPARCVEIRVELTDEERMSYALAEPEQRYRVGSTARSKLAVVKSIVSQARAQGEPILVIGSYLDQLEEIAKELDAPLITGSTTGAVRERLYQSFRDGKEELLVVSKVANFSIDLPDASVAIQISGGFGSRQEEAQRLGRILRPKADRRQAHFFTIVSRDTNDQEFARKRQRFLSEQGYAYEIIDAADINSDGGLFDVDLG